METFSALLAFCAGNSPVTGEFLSQRPVTRNFDVFFDLRSNKRLSKQSRSWWFETPSRPLWRHCNESSLLQVMAQWSSVNFCITSRVESVSKTRTSRCKKPSKSSTKMVMALSTRTSLNRWDPNLKCLFLNSKLSFKATCNASKLMKY